MNSEQIQLVKRSYARVEYLADELGAMFYRTLFERHPQVIPLFATVNGADQTMSFSLALGMIIRSLDQPEKLYPMAEALAVRHVNYGVFAEHYDAVGDALIETLRASLKRHFDVMTEQAWIEAYDELARVMKRAAYGHDVIAELA